MANKKVEKIYEVSFHLVPEMDEEAAARLAEDLRSAIADKNEVLGTEEIQRIDLTYTIRHRVRRSDGSYNRYNEAYFGAIKFRAPTSYVTTLDESLRKNESVLRFLIVETVAEDTRIGPDLPGGDEENQPGTRETTKSSAKDKGEVQKTDDTPSEETADTPQTPEEEDATETPTDTEESTTDTPTDTIDETPESRGILQGTEKYNV